MTESESVALPLGDAAIFQAKEIIYQRHKIVKRFLTKLKTIFIFFRDFKQIKKERNDKVTPLMLAYKNSHPFISFKVSSIPSAIAFAYFSIFSSKLLLSALLEINPTSAKTDGIFVLRFM